MQNKCFFSEPALCTYVQVSPVLLLDIFRLDTILWTYTNNADLDQMPQIVASDHGLHCFLYKNFMQNTKKKKKDLNILQK